MIIRDCINSTIFIFFVFITSTVYTLNATSEVFKWKDKNGNIHFGDKPPMEASAKNISKKTSKVNIASKLSPSELTLKYEMIKESEKRKVQRAFENLKKKPDSRTCEFAVSFLHDLRESLVIGGEAKRYSDLSEGFRRARIRALEISIREKC
mgnify:CR=1 FL=1